MKQLESERERVQSLSQASRAIRVNLSLDPLERMKDLESAIQSLGESIEADDVYIVTVPRPEESVLPPAPPTQEPVYLADGKLNCDYLMRNAELLFTAGDTALARNIYETLLKSGERTAVAHFGLARCFEKEGNFENSLKHYRESVTYHPTKIAYRRWIRLLVKTGDFGAAAEAASTALLMPSLEATLRSELHQVAGNCLAKTENLDQAERHYLKGLECDPTSDDLRANLGALYLQRGKIGDAKRQFQDALAANPSNAKAHEGLGSCYYAEGNAAAAHDSFATGLEIEIQNPHAVFYLIKCAYDLKSYAAAARLGERYIGVAPINAHLLYSVAGLNFHLGKMNESRALLEQALRIQPQHTGAKELMESLSRFQEGKWQQI